MKKLFSIILATCCFASIAMAEPHADMDKFVGQYEHLADAAFEARNDCGHLSAALDKWIEENRAVVDANTRAHHGNPYSHDQQGRLEAAQKKIDEAYHGKCEKDEKAHGSYGRLPSWR